MSNTVTDIRITGSAVQPGDWVMWIRADEHTDCASAFDSGIANDELRGGLVYETASGEMFVDTQLPGGIDGPVDPNPHDDVQSIDSSL